MEKCIGIWGKIFGHKFKAIYDEKREPPVGVQYGPAYPSDLAMLIEAETKYTTTYICHVCSRCGMKIKKDI